MKQYPDLVVAFPLTFNGRDPEADPLVLARQHGYRSLEWRHQGSTITKLVTANFQLVSVGHCHNWNELTERLVTRGQDTEGQWLEAFRRIHRAHGSDKFIGVADPSWFDSRHHAFFPYLDLHGRWRLASAARVFTTRWLWLVKA